MWVAEAEHTQYREIKSRASIRHTILAMKGDFSDPNSCTKNCDTTPHPIATNPFAVDISPKMELSRPSSAKPCLFTSLTIHASNVVNSRVVLTPPSALPKKRMFRSLVSMVRQETE